MRADGRHRLLEARLRDRLEIVVIVEVVLVAVLTALVWHSHAPDRIDARVARLLYAQPGTSLRSATSAVSTLGQPWVVALASFAVGWWAWRRTRDVVIGAFAPVAVGVTSLVSHLLKLAIERPRPATAVFAHEIDFSFPSGHATGAAALALCVVLLATALGVRRRRVVVAVSVLYATVICVSRLVLGVHYLTDIVGGVAVGTAGVLVAGWVCTSSVAVAATA